MGSATATSSIFEMPSLSLWNSSNSLAEQTWTQNKPNSIAKCFMHTLWITHPLRWYCFCITCTLVQHVLFQTIGIYKICLLFPILCLRKYLQLTTEGSTKEFQNTHDFSMLITAITTSTPLACLSKRQIYCKLGWPLNLEKNLNFWKSWLSPSRLLLH